MFEHDPIADIAHLRSLVTERYESSSILLELMQNADDAGATLLKLAWMVGGRDALPPLLATPALVVLNDGKFVDADAQAICRLGLGAKGGERGTIGKFGLGLKSVFHLAEAFFFLDSALQPEPRLLNPWWDPSRRIGFHGDWEEFDPQILRTAMVPLVEDLSRWFCLWIPLRSHSQVGDVAPITESFPGDVDDPPDELFSGGAVVQAAELLPLLRNLRVLSFLAVRGGAVSEIQRVDLVKTSDRRLFPDLASGAWRDTRGRWRFHHPTPREIPYWGTETVSDDHAFAELRRKDGWPQTTRINRDTGRSEQAPDDTLPHVLVSWSCQPAGPEESRLRIIWSAFTPLSEDRETFPLKLPHDVALNIHGHFFVDSGRRRRIDAAVSAADKSRERQAEWNLRLSSDVALPLVLEGLRDLVADEKLKPAHIQELASALARSQLFLEHRAAVCKRGQWVHRRVQGRSEWTLVPPGDFLAIPPPPEDAPDLPDIVLPGLAAMTERLLVCLGGDVPRLTEAEHPRRWTEEEVLEALSMNSANPFSGRGWKDHLEYLVRYLEDPSVQPTCSAPLVVGRLCTQAQAVLAALTDARWSQHRAVVERMLALLPKERLVRLELSIGSPAFASIRTTAFEAALRSVLAPATKESPPTARTIEAEDARILLEALGGLEGDRAVGRSKAAGVLVRHVSDLGENWAALEQIAVFDARTGDGGSELVSRADLLRAKNSATLFIKHPSSMAPLLRSATTGTRVLEVESDVAEALFSSGEVGICNADACVRALTVGGHRLGSDLTARVDLLERLSPDQRIPAHVQATRYLLHGDFGRLGDNLTELYVDDRADTWSRVTRKALGPEGRWRWIDLRLANVITRALAQAARLAEPSLDTVVQCLRDRNLIGRIDFSSLTDEDREALLREVPDDDLLRRLPIHETTDGRLVAIVARAYLGTGLDFADDLGITVLRPASNLRLHDKQVRLVESRVLDARTYLELLLRQPAPEHRAEIILDLIAMLSPDTGLPPESKTATWLPSQGSGVAPAEVLDLAQLPGEALRDLGGIFTLESDLAEDLRRHPAWKRVLALMPGPVVALDLLGQALAGEAQYHLGALSGPLDADGLTAVLEAKSGDALRRLLAAAQLLAQVRRGYGPEGAEALRQPLARAISLDRTKAILSVLADAHDEATADQKKPILALHDQYLACFARSATTEDLRGLRLRNQESRWRAAEKLCVDAFNLARSALLSRDHEIIVRRLVSEPARAPATPRECVGQAGASDREALDRELERTAIEVERYFSKWPNYVAPAAIGGFLAVLGDAPQMLALAGRYLGSMDLKAVRRGFDWDLLEEARVGAGTIDQVLESQRILVRITDDGARSVPVMNLLGEMIQVRQSDDLGNLILGRPRWLSEYLTHPVFEVRLAPVEPSEHSPQELGDWLRESARIVLQTAYQRTSRNLETLFRHLLQNVQNLDIRLARKLVLDESIQYLRQLGASRAPKLVEHCRRYRELKRRLTGQEEMAQTREGYRIDADLKAQAEEARRSVGELLATDSETQGAVLAVIRSKMRDHYQYTPDSVPFELFQNADDATAELLVLCAASGLPPSEAQGRFVVEHEGARLRFLHWGRRINQSRHGAIEIADRGFDQDLEHMLVLSSSEKSERGRVTGKFGLGFKSVLLLGDAPRVLSGALGFQVLGGLYPQDLQPDDRSELTAALAQAGGGGAASEGTAVEVRVNSEESVAQVLGRFAALAPVLLVFSRATKTCRVRFEGRSTTHHWSESPAPGAEGLFVGTLHGLGSHPVTAAVFRAPATDCALLLAVGRRGFEQLSRAGEHAVPAIWVTAPTRHDAHLGFAINGPFLLDIGRAQVAHDAPQNEDLARQFGVFLGERLIALFDGFASGTIHRDALGLGPEVDADTLFASLFDVLGRNGSDAEGRRGDPETGPKEPSARLLWLILASSDGVGLRRLISERSALPTGLIGLHAANTRLSAVAFRTVGYLDTDGGSLLDLASQNPRLRRNYPPGSVISDARVARACPAFGLTGANVRPLSLSGLITDLLPDADVTPEEADQGGALLAKQTLANLGEDETKDLHEALKERNFRTRSGAFAPSGQIVVGHGEEPEQKDERSRAAFAPADNVLAREYSDRARGLFLFSRRRLAVGAETMAHWVKRAQGDARKAAVEYLLSGDLSREVARSLVAITSVDERLALIGACGKDEHAKRLLHGLLETGRDPRQDQKSKPPIAEPKSALERIHDWWLLSGKRHLAEYESKLYAGRIPMLKPEPVTTEDRVAWLELFLVAGLHTVGFAEPSAIGGFLSIARSRRWLETLADARGPREQVFVQVDEFVEEGIAHTPYASWLKELLTTFIVANRLETCVDALLEMTKDGASSELSHHLNTRTNPALSGTGLSAPPLTDFFGIGSCALVRELARQQVLQGPAVHRHCYVPRRQLREIMKRLGCDGVEDHHDQRWMRSREIYQHLTIHLGPEHAIFGGAFDIPLLLVANDTNLQRSLGIDESADDGEDEEWRTLPDGRRIRLGA